MKFKIVVGLWIFLLKQSFFPRIDAKDLCRYNNANGTIGTIYCFDTCCSDIAASINTVCCSSTSWGTLAVPFFIVVAICIAAVCLIYCRPLWRMLLCGHKCPCDHRRQIQSSNTAVTHENPVFFINNDGLPDYSTIIKETPTKEINLPDYAFVTSHPNEFGIETHAPASPPQYRSRHNSLAPN